LVHSRARIYARPSATLINFLASNLSNTNLSPALRPLDLNVEEFVSPLLHPLKPGPSGQGGARSGLKAGVLYQAGIRIKFTA